MQISYVYTIGLRHFPVISYSFQVCRMTNNDILSLKDIFRSYYLKLKPLPFAISEKCPVLLPEIQFNILRRG
jgi:hypothetical protein